MKKILFIIIIPIIIFFIVSQIDDDLDPRAAQLIEKIDNNSKSQSYLLLSGIFAAANENPITVGQTLLDEYNKLAVDEAYKIVEYNDDKKLPLPTGELFCKFSQDGCIKALFNTNTDINNLLQQHQTLLARVKLFHQLNDYKTLTKPLLNQPSPDFSYLINAQRLKTLEAIAIHQQGSSQQAISFLLNQFSTVRKSLASQDTLIGKVAFLSTLSDIIDVTSIIITQEKLDSAFITQLTLAEKSMTMAAAREFAAGYYIYKELDKRPDFFQMGGDNPEWFIRMIYKPHMTINAVIPSYLRLEQLATLSPVEFTNEVKLQSPPSTSTFRNYVGSILIDVASANYDHYVAMLFDLDAKLTMFNQLHHEKKALSEIINPYNELQPPVISANKVCFDGPTEDKNLFRCLATNLSN